MWPKDQPAVVFAPATADATANAGLGGRSPSSPRTACRPPTRARTPLTWASGRLLLIRLALASGRSRRDLVHREVDSAIGGPGGHILSGPLPGARDARDERAGGLTGFRRELAHRS